MTINPRDMEVTYDMAVRLSPRRVTRSIDRSDGSYDILTTGDYHTLWTRYDSSGIAVKAFLLGLGTGEILAQYIRVEGDGLQSCSQEEYLAVGR